MKRFQILAIATFLVVTPALISCKSKKDKEKEQTTTTVDPVKTDPPVTTATDDALTMGLRDALKDHPTVNYSINDGKIVLTGEIAKDKWLQVKQTLDKLTSKGYDLTGLTIK